MVDQCSSSATKEVTPELLGVSGSPLRRRLSQTGLSGNRSFQLPPLHEQGGWYFLTVSVRSIRALKREEARQRMADLRHARRNRRAALAVQRASSLFGDAAKWRLTNLAEVLKAMS